MVPHFDRALRQLVRMQDHQPVVQVKRNAIVRIANVFVGVEQYLVRILVIANLLLLLRNRHGNLDGLPRIANGSVQAERVLGLLGDVVSFTHQVVNQLMRQRFNLGFGDHVDHVRNVGLPLLNVQLERLVQLFALLVVFGCAAPLRFSLVKLGDLKVFIFVLLVNFEDNLRIFVHFLMRLGNHESVLAFATQDQKLDSFLLTALQFAKVGQHESTLRQLALGVEYLLGSLQIVQVLQIQPNHILVIVCLLISLLSFSILLFGLFCLCN